MLHTKVSNHADNYSCPTAYTATVDTALPMTVIIITTEWHFLVIIMSESVLDIHEHEQ